MTQLSFARMISSRYSNMIKTIAHRSGSCDLWAVGMATNLLKTGYKLTVWNRNAENASHLLERARALSDTPGDAVRDVIWWMYSLSNDQAVEDVVFGSKGILSESRRADRDGHEHGSTATSLRNRKLTQSAVLIFLMRLSLAANKIGQCQALIMARASSRFRNGKPVWNTWDKPFIICKNGNAAAMKLVGNLIVALELEALAEGLFLAQKRDSTNRDGML